MKNGQPDRPTGPVKLKGLKKIPTITNYREWRTFLERPVPERPVFPERKVRRTWSEEQWAAFNLIRHEYHAGFPPIATPQLQRFHKQILLQIWKNIDGDDGACAGGLLNGLGTLGKTTILKSLGRKFELDFNKKHPAEDPEQQDLVIPVAFVSMSAGATPKDLSLRLARYYNLPLPRSTKGVTKIDVTAAVVESAKNHGTQVIMVDEAHRINVHTDQGKLANDHFKDLMTETGATFVFAGINCRSLLSEGNSDARWSQIGGRMIYQQIDPMTQNSEEWTGVLTDLENLLVLGNLPAGTLSVGLHDYLYGRTGGSIGSLLNLIRKAAKVAIDSRSEAITEELLADIEIDSNAELTRAREEASKLALQPTVRTRRPAKARAARETVKGTVVTP